jgi:acrylyl-CoA reductase (NADPH)
MFKAFRVEEEEGQFLHSIREMEVSPMADGEIRVKVYYSSLNYKDALSASGNRGVTRSYPHTPGIDALGKVEASASELWESGDEVIVTGHDLGMNTNGGFAEYIQVPAQWAIALPKGLTMREAMMFGTAGLTAGASVWELSKSVKPGDGKIAVSGATGGVGSLGVAVLSKLGYSVTAITGKESERGYLMGLGAQEVLARAEIENMNGRPLMRSTFAGAIDTVGGTILENIIASTKPRGIVTCCGNVASPDLQLSVYPFILRAVSLIGISSQDYPTEDRLRIWDKLSGEWKPDQLYDMCNEIALEDLHESIDQMLQGKLRRRVIIRL